MPERVLVQGNKAIDWGHKYRLSSLLWLLYHAPERDHGAFDKLWYA